MTTTVLTPGHLADFLRGLPDRCPACLFHVPSQGHGGDCAATAPADERTRVLAAVRQLAATGRPFSANDARELHGVKGGVVGKVFREAKDAGLIRPYFDGQPLPASTSESTNGHRLFRWVGAAA